MAAVAFFAVGFAPLVDVFRRPTFGAIVFALLFDLVALPFLATFWIAYTVRDPSQRRWLIRAVWTVEVLVVYVVPVLWLIVLGVMSLVHVLMDF
jgi:hypothetical protein